MGAIEDVVFLIPVITPSYFASPACRSEYQKFLTRERTLGEDRLIFPLYYVTHDDLHLDPQKSGDNIIKSVSSRQWTDWRPLRFKDISSSEVSETIHQMARAIKRSIAELSAVIEASRERPVATKQKAQKRSSGTALDSATPSKASTVLPTSERVQEDPGRQRGPETSYTSFTTIYDEVITPDELVDAEEIVRLSDFIKPTINLFRNSFAPRLRRIRSILTTFPKDVTFSFLIDNSGSMRGNKILYCAAWCSIFVEEFSQHSISFEILGFTTRAWKGGLSRELWLQKGKALGPGRLNDVRYIVYKSFSQSQSDALTNIGLMCREGLLKENIDGEALLWACERARSLRKSKNIILFFTDGAPVDDSTLSANSKDYLEQHLKQVVSWADRQRDLVLVALGLEFTPNAIFRNSLVIKDPAKIGDYMGDALNLAKSEISAVEV